MTGGEAPQSWKDLVDEGEKQKLAQQGEAYTGEGVEEIRVPVGEEAEVEEALLEKVLEAEAEAEAL